MIKSNEECTLLRNKLLLLICCLMFNKISAQQRPRILEHPSDAIAAREEPLTLNCKATGRPHPEIFWYHNGTPLIPSERRVILPEGSLFFLRVVFNKREQDTGIYRCEAKSSAGIAVSNNASLQIAHLKDEFQVEPQNTTALLGGVITLNCTPPRGIPEPSVLWYKDKKLLDLRGKRLSLVANGSLHISEVLRMDSGLYECSAQNMAGRKDANPAVLKVLTPPRVIRGPSNTEVIEGDRIDIPCEIDGDPKPVSIWQRDGKTFPEGRARILLDNTLRIEDVRADDEGKYYCKAFNDGGNITISIEIHVFAIPRIMEASSDLAVSEGDNLKMICRASGRPTAIIVWDILAGETNSPENIMNKSQNLFGIKLTQAISNHSSLIKLDDSSSQTQEGIKSSDTTLKPPLNTALSNFGVIDNGELLIKNIQVNNKGWYVCAAINEAGSDVKSVYVKVDSKNVSQSEALKQKGYWTNIQNIFITGVIPVSSNTLDILWEYDQVTISEREMTIYYRPIRIDEPGGRILSRDYLSIQTTYEKKIFRIFDLNPYTNYEIFATLPGGLMGSISNLRKGKTLDGPPSAPPSDVRVGVINNTAAYVRWSPPPKHLINGELTGYKIQIKSNVTNKLLGQMSLNASTQSVVINSLSPGGRYTARVAPLTIGGLGPYSPPASLHIDTSFIPHTHKSDPTTVSWPLSWMSGIAFGICGFFLLSATVFTIVWAKKNKRNLKGSFPAHSLSSSQINKEQTIWVKNSSTIVKQTYTCVVPPPPPTVLSSSEYAEVSSIKITKINNGVSQLEPYATVTLPENDCRSTLKECVNDRLNLKISNNECYQTNQTSDDSYQKCDISPSSSGYNAPINLCDVLPPPPSYPDAHFFSINKSNYNMTIRTNPTALSPRSVRRQILHLESNWRNPGLPPPIPNFPHNWIQERQDNFERVDPCWYSQYQFNANTNHSNGSLMFNQFNSQKNKVSGDENEYESGSVLYEQLLRDKESFFFSEVGEPTEKYYRNVNMEFYDEKDFESSTPPPPCPSDPYSRKDINFIIASQSEERGHNQNQFHSKSARLNCEPHNSNLAMNNKEVLFGKRKENDCYNGTYSSDENEFEENNWKNRPRRSKSKSSEKCFFTGN